MAALVSQVKMSISMFGNSQVKVFNGKGKITIQLYTKSLVTVCLQKFSVWNNYGQKLSGKKICVLLIYIQKQANMVHIAA